MRGIKTKFVTIDIQLRMVLHENTCMEDTKEKEHQIALGSQPFFLNFLNQSKRLKTVPLTFPSFAYSQDGLNTKTKLSLPP